MKSSESPNLYELLRSAARPSTEPAGETLPQKAAPAAATATTEPSLQERLAAYKASKLAIAQPAAPPAATAAPIAAAVPERPPAPKAAPPAPVKVLSGPLAATPGERMLHVSVNTAVFVGLVGLGLLFAAYSLGVRSGRSQAAADGGAPVANAPAPAKTYAIRLVEWSIRTSKENLTAEDAAHEVKAALDKAGHPGARIATVQRGSERRMVIYLGSFTDPSSESAKAKLAAVRAVKVRGQPILAQAGFEQAAP